MGHTENLQDRIFRHTNSGSKSTKKADNWIVRYTEEFDSRSAAMHRELEIKNKKKQKIY
ncbi:MAG: GIY-YIG nuclease family protein [Chitinophagaceae bacterium]|nr:GIY-YIG nuclease family protein [Chitinophagaceae bacterium]